MEEKKEKKEKSVVLEIQNVVSGHKSIFNPNLNKEKDKNGKVNSR